MIRTQNGGLDSPRSSGRLKRVTSRFDVRAVDADTGEFSGWAMVFGEMDDYGTIFDRGCFLASLADHRQKNTMPSMLKYHDWHHILGRWTLMEERDGGPTGAGGLYVEGGLEMRTQDGREMAALIDNKPRPALDGLSVGFLPIDGYRDAAGVLHFTEVQIWETSLLPFPSQMHARLERAAEDIHTERDLEDVLRDAGYSRSGARAIASRFKPKGDAQRDAARDDVGPLRALLDDVRRSFSV